MQEELKCINEKLNTITKTLELQQENFEQKISQVTINFHNTILHWTMILATSIEAMSIIRYYAARKETVTLDELKEGVISCIQRLEELHQTLASKEPDLAKYTMERERLIFGALIDLAKRKNIPPGEILALLQETLDANGLRAVISIEDVTRVFGTGEAYLWRRLIKD